jgi:hypothetical protein
MGARQTYPLIGVNPIPPFLRVDLYSIKEDELNSNGKLKDETAGAQFARKTAFKMKV